MIAASVTIAALLIVPATGPVKDRQVDEWHTWTVTEVFTGTPRDAGDVAWPQTYLGPGKLTASCGWVQQDRYKGKRSAIDGILADGILTYGEDFGVVKEWRYVYAGPCATPEPTPTPSVTPEPTPEPTVTPEPTPEPSQTPTPEPTVEPTPEPSQTPTPSVTPSTTPTPTVPAGPDPTATPAPQPGETEGVGTPHHTERVARLAETGNELNGPLTIGAVLAIIAGAALLRRKKAAR